MCFWVLKLESVVVAVWTLSSGQLSLESLLSKLPRRNMCVSLLMSLHLGWCRCVQVLVLVFWLVLVLVCVVVAASEA